MIIDLGVLFDSRLSFKQHIKSIVCRASKMLSFVLRFTHDFKNVQTLKTLYFTLIRAILEYNLAIWNPFTQNINQLIEKIQHTFLRSLLFKLWIRYNRFNCDYDTILIQCGMLTLENRRFANDVMLLFKMINGLINSADLLVNVKLKIPSRFTHQTEIFHIPFASINASQNSILNRLQRSENKICDNVNFFVNSIAHFKSTLYAYLNLNRWMNVSRFVYIYSVLSFVLLY